MTPAPWTTYSQQPPPPPPSGGNKGKVIAGAVLAAVLVAAVVGFLLTRGGEDEEATEGRTTDTSVSDTPATDAPDAPDAPDTTEESPPTEAIEEDDPPPTTDDPGISSGKSPTADTTIGGLELIDDSDPTDDSLYIGNCMAAEGGTYHEAPCDSPEATHYVNDYLPDASQCPEGTDGTLTMSEEDLAERELDAAVWCINRRSGS